MTLTRKIGFILFLPTFGAVIAWVVFYAFFAQTASDGHFINVAGRQRMLSQQAFAYANLVAMGQEGSRGPLKEAVNTFDASLRAIQEGGSAMGVDLTPAPREIWPAIEKVRRLWSRLRPSFELIAERPAGDPQALRAYDQVRSDIQLLTDAADGVVSAYEARRYALRRRVYAVLAAVAGFDAVLLLVGLWVISRYVTRPVLMAEQAARRVRAGDFSYRLPIMTRDEMATLAEAFNEMSAATAEMLAERERTQAELRYLADHDPLTGLFNRRRFQAELQRQLEEARQNPTQGALIFIDLDGFKYVNDSLGHQTGDLLLTQIGNLLQDQVKDNDVLARLGGDEFAVILPRTGRAEAEELARDILHALKRHQTVIDGHSLQVSASIGIALFPQHGMTAERLLSRADLALYQVKESGRNSYCLFTPDRAGLDEAKLTWEKRIRLALENDGFVLYCQPILDLRSHQVTHYELLLRLIGEDGQVVLPGAFLGVAERFGLIHDIDRWVVWHAIELLADQERAGRELCLGVNLSGRAFADPELLPLIRREVVRRGLDPGRLMLEITETAAIADVRRARHFVLTLREMGCHFAIDDFGVGFASFYYMKHLPVDYLKIDGSFIRNLPHDRTDQHVVQAIVAVARGLEKKTIAEYVEEEEMLALLKEYGVDYAQGYHVGHPRPVSELLST